MRMALPARLNPCRESIKIIQIKTQAPREGALFARGIPGGHQ